MKFNKLQNAYQDWALSFERRHDNAGEVLKRGLKFNGMAAAGLLITAGSQAAKAHPLLKLGCGIGLAAAFLRFGLYLDMYALQAVHDGSDNPFAHLAERVLRKTPYRYFSTIKLQAIDMRRGHMTYIADLQRQIADDPKHATALRQQIAACDRISDFINPANNLLWGTMVGIGAGTSLTQVAVHLGAAASAAPVTVTAIKVAGVALSFTFAAAEFGVYSTKRIVIGDRHYVAHPLHRFFLGTAHRVAMASPVRYASWLLLHREQKKVAKLTVSPDLQRQLVIWDVPRQLAGLMTAAQSPRKMAAIRYQDILIQ